MPPEKNFALIGAAGYIAPRHLKAIKETGNNLVAALDPHDSVGILDSWFPHASFFTEFERFDRHIDKAGRQKTSPGLDPETKDAVDYVTICSPNYLHDAHIRWTLRSGADAICEKPMVLNPWNVDALEEFEHTSGKRVWNIMQMRLHPEAVKLQSSLYRNNEKATNRARVKLQYIAPRGTWYHHSWKGDITKSGGIATNIGIHFFDLLIWLFGSVENSKVLQLNHLEGRGELVLKNADVEWFLSIDSKQQTSDLKSSRMLTINGNPVDFSSGFTDLHTKSYREILNGNGFGIQEVRPSIELVHQIRSAGVI